MSDDNACRYLDLLKKSLLNELYPELEAQLLHVVLNLAYRRPLELERLWQARRDETLLKAIAASRAGGDSFVLRGLNGVGIEVDRPDLRNYAEFAHTMIGRTRLDHLQRCIETVLDEDVPGDLLEAGVWRGGACVLMAAVLAARGHRERRVWLADSFLGLPPPAAPQDAGYDMSAAVLPVLAVGEDEVRSLFERYGLFDTHVRFLRGWFSESLPRAGIDALAVLRIDADLYESTRDALSALYDRVAPGGFVIIDDYRILPPCREAVDEFRAQRGIEDSIEAIDGHAVFWRKRSL